jgi:hypothetical protein
MTGLICARSKSRVTARSDIQRFLSQAWIDLRSVPGYPADTPSIVWHSVGGDMNERNSRIGLVFFFIYLVFYFGFVFLNAFALDVMKTTPYVGIHLAVMYGFGLIVAAFVLALLYGVICSPPSEDDDEEDEL